MDFEASVAENRFTIKPNVDPAIDESKSLPTGFSYLHSHDRKYTEYSETVSIHLLTMLRPSVRKEEDDGVVQLLDRCSQKRARTPRCSHPLLLCHLHPSGLSTQLIYIFPASTRMY